MYDIIIILIYFIFIMQMKGEEGDTGMSMKNEVSTNEEDQNAQNKISIGAGRQDNNQKVTYFNLVI